jgi:hypothetical protein
VSPPDPIFLATAVEIVLRAGEIQMARRESGFRIDKKGAIDLVTEVDLECERMCRSVIAERFPDHDILAEEFSSGPGEPARASHRWVFDPIDGTTTWPSDLLFVPGPRDRREAGGRCDLRPDTTRTVHRRARARCVSERRPSEHLGDLALARSLVGDRISV